MRSNVIMYIGLILTILELVVLTNITAQSSYGDSIRGSLENSLERSIYLTRTDANEHQVGTLNATESQELYGSDAIVLKGDMSASDFKSRFVNHLSTDLDPHITKLDVNIYGADEDKGVLSAEVTATYKYIGGKEGRVTVRRTVILNKIKK